MILAYSSGGLVREVRGALAGVGESEVVVAAQHHRAESGCTLVGNAGTFGGDLHPLVVVPGRLRRIR